MDRYLAIIREEITKFIIKEGIEILGNHANVLNQLLPHISTMKSTDTNGKEQPELEGFLTRLTVYIRQIIAAVQRCVQKNVLTEDLSQYGINVPRELDAVNPAAWWNNFKQGYNNTGYFMNSMRGYGNYAKYQNRNQIKNNGAIDTSVPLSKLLEQYDTFKQDYNNIDNKFRISSTLGSAPGSAIREIGTLKNDFVALVGGQQQQPNQGAGNQQQQNPQNGGNSQHNQQQTQHPVNQTSQVTSNQNQLISQPAYTTTTTQNYNYPTYTTTQNYSSSESKPQQPVTQPQQTAANYSAYAQKLKSIDPNGDKFAAIVEKLEQNDTVQGNQVSYRGNSNEATKCVPLIQTIGNFTEMIINDIESNNINMLREHMLSNNIDYSYSTIDRTYNNYSQQYKILRDSTIRKTMNTLQNLYIQIKNGGKN